jgi:hypothetical protein
MTLVIRPLETKINNFRAMFITEELYEMSLRRINRTIYPKMRIFEDRKKSS